MSNPGIKWFKHGTAWDVKFAGVNKSDKIVKGRIVIYEYEDDRREAIIVAVNDIAGYGYSYITIDHIVRIGI